MPALLSDVHLINAILCVGVGSETRFCYRPGVRRQGAQRSARAFWVAAVINQKNFPDVYCTGIAECPELPQTQRVDVCHPLCSANRDFHSSVSSTNYAVFKNRLVDFHLSSRRPGFLINCWKDVVVLNV